MHTQVRLSIHGSGFLLREEVEGGAPQALSCRITGVGNPPLTPVVVGAAQYPEGDDSTLTHAPTLPHIGLSPSPASSAHPRVNPRTHSSQVRPRRGGRRGGPPAKCDVHRGGHH